MKEKISLILVLGIVGVLVTSLIIDSRVSATLESFDVEVCREGYGCDYVGYVEMPDLISVLDDIIDTWRTEIVDWESILETDDFEAYTPYLISAFESDSSLEYILDVLDDIPTYITYYEGFDEYDLGDDLPTLDLDWTVCKEEVNPNSSYSYIAQSPLGTKSVTVYMWHGAVYHREYHDFP